MFLVGAHGESTMAIVLTLIMSCDWPCKLVFLSSALTSGILFNIYSVNIESSRQMKADLQFGFRVAPLH